MNSVQTEINFSPALLLSDPTLPDDVLSIIGYLSQFCRGADYAASAKTIGSYLGFRARKVRHLISLYLDRFPFVVCATPGNGFFISTDPADLAHYEATLHALLQAAAIRIRSFRILARRCGYTRTGPGPHARYSKNHLS